MIPQLKPELYLKIAQHIRRSFPVHDGPLPSVETAINVEQDTLLNLMMVSKVSGPSQ